MTNTSTALSINQQIHAFGPALFETVKETIREEATKPIDCKGNHDKNKILLDREIELHLGYGKWNGFVCKKHFWKTAWERIVYTGTKSQKASFEIKSMADFSIFENLDEFDENEYTFDEHAWDAFSYHWKRRFFWYELAKKYLFNTNRDDAAIDTPQSLAGLLLNQTSKIKVSDSDKKVIQAAVAPVLNGAIGTKGKANPNNPNLIHIGAQTEDWKLLFTRYRNRRTVKKDEQWLDFAKSESVEFSQSLRYLDSLGTKARELMTKTGSFSGIRFSADPQKMRKYVKLAKTLKNHNDQNALTLFARDYVFIQAHQYGEDYIKEKESFWKAQLELEQYLGPITSLHLLMDLGFKTIKPDRVMAYLFSRLGWLETLPASLTKKEVLDKYTNESVIEEVLHRADVLAAALSSYYIDQPTHRLLDIWFVKFGQDPEEKFGITVNLEKNDEGLEKLLKEVKLDIDRLTTTPSPHRGSEADWPTTWKCRRRIKLSLKK